MHIVARYDKSSHPGSMVDQSVTQTDRSLCKTWYVAEKNRKNKTKNRSCFGNFSLQIGISDRLTGNSARERNTPKWGIFSFRNNKV